MIDIQIGQKFDRWTVINIKKLHRNMTECRCVCGNIKLIYPNTLRNGGSQSCGCKRAEQLLKRNKTHGYSKTPTYSRWISMMQRVRNDNLGCKKYYSEKGIKVCDKWHMFENFLNDMGECPSKNHTLDRVNSNEGYSRDNCRWATCKQQARNTSRNHFITYNGITKCIGEWAEITGINYKMLWNRIHRGWSLERALTIN
jgi:hypothetical protein